ncbi:hypothetical protein CEXT_815321 [Caerostris extrusa]|uniref:Uncharacterized protein n=1 Tax=Caerostris extrusa TaxID=172846 RepID=A0AAV4PR00_CAEEX|nr:hypothetical protein CEXT_815321 [Caerostris extrusa]
MKSRDYLNASCSTLNFKQNKTFIRVAFFLLSRQSAGIDESIFARGIKKCPPSLPRAAVHQFTEQCVSTRTRCNLARGKNRNKISIPLWSLVAGKRISPAEKCVEWMYPTLSKGRWTDERDLVI